MYLKETERFSSFTVAVVHMSLSTAVLLQLMLSTTLLGLASMDTTKMAPHGGTWYQISEFWTLRFVSFPETYYIHTKSFFNWRLKYIILGPISVCHQFQDVPRQLEYPDGSLAQKVKVIGLWCTLLERAVGMYAAFLKCRKMPRNNCISFSITYIQITEYAILNTKTNIDGSYCSSQCDQVWCVFPRVCYERCRINPMAATFVLSAMWHGVYPGYYLTFLTGIAMTMAARAVSTHIVLSIRQPLLGDFPSPD